MISQVSLHLSWVFKKVRRVVDLLVHFLEILHAAKQPTRWIPGSKQSQWEKLEVTFVGENGSNQFQGICLSRSSHETALSDSATLRLNLLISSCSYDARLLVQQKVDFYGIFRFFMMSFILHFSDFHFRIFIQIYSHRKLEPDFEVEL